MRAGWGGLAIVALVAPAPAAQQTPPPEDDIVIIARKMRTVRLEYSVRGPWLRRCRPLVSSGDARIDRLTCAILADCIRVGGQDRLRPQQCVGRRIASLETQSVAAAETMVAPFQPPVERAARKAGADEIVVTGRREVLASGMWSLREQGNYSSSRGTSMLRPRSWRVCVAPDTAEKTFGALLEEPQGRGQPGRCTGWKIKIEGDRVAGEMRCMRPTFRTNSILEGSFTATEVTLRKRRRSIPLRGDFEATGQFAIVGRRTGDC